MWEQRENLHSTSARTAWDEEIPYSNMYPPNLAVKWIDTDSAQNQKYEKDITYTFNEHGYRGDSLHSTSDINILCCGCSITVGVGVDDDETWANQLKRKISKHANKSVTAWNLSTSGASPDYVTRMVFKATYSLKPSLVFVYWPPMTRLELPDERNPAKVIQSAIDAPWFPKTLVNEDYLEYNFFRNLHFLEGMYIPRLKRHFFSNTVVQTMVQNHMHDEYPFLTDKNGRDGLHPGPDWHEKLADHFFKKYINISTTLE